MRWCLPILPVVLAALLIAHVSCVRRHVQPVPVTSPPAEKKTARTLKHNGAWYRDRWVKHHGGVAEVRLVDGSRSDILTDEYAIEVDWARNWPKAVGQSLWYAYQTNNKPGIVVNVRTDNDRKHLMRLRSLIEHENLGIRVWVEEPGF